MKSPLPAGSSPTPCGKANGGLPRLDRLKRFVPLAAVVASVGLAYSTIVEPRRLRAVAYTLLVPNLPPTLAGLRIAHLTDFHVGMRGTPPSVLARAVARAVAWRPDLALLTGDFVHRGRWLPEADLFRGLAAEAPTYAVLGNHDSWGTSHEMDRIAAALEDSGVTILRNRATTVRLRDRGEIVLVGVEDPSLQRDDLERAMVGLPAAPEPCRPTILLAHAPEIADRAPEGRFALIVSGHTHGGQLRFSPVQHRTFLDIGMIAGGLVSPYARGAWLVRGNPLYVNSGLGLSGLPLRFLAPPEVVLFTLQPAPEGADPVINPFVRAVPDAPRVRRPCQPGTTKAPLPGSRRGASS